MKFKLLEGITVADVAFEAYGKTVEELFENAALALTSVMVDVKTVGGIHNLEFKIQNEKLEDLLFDFLSEIVFLKDSKNLLFSKYRITIEKQHNLNILHATFLGEEINRKKHHLKIDVKAVTKHQFFLREDKNGFRCRVVLDV